MAERNPRQAYQRVKALASENPHVEQDLTKWYDVEAEEIAPGEWQLMVNGEPEQIIDFSEADLSVNELYAARKYTTAQGEYVFQPTITIDSPKGKYEPGPLAQMTQEERRARVQEAVRRANINVFGDEEGFKPRPEPEPTLGSKVKRLVRKIALRLGIRPPW